MITAIAHTFHGAPLQTLEWNGRPCWVARHIGARLGYSADGGRFVKKVGDWMGELVEGRDYAYLDGPDLAAFKEANSVSVPKGDQQLHKAPRVLVLFESGVNLTTLKTSKPLGATLRRFLSDEVLPQLARTGSYSPQPTEALAPAAPRSPPSAPAVVEPQTIVVPLDPRVDSLERAVVALTEAVTALATQAQAQQQGARQGMLVTTTEASFVVADPVPPHGFGLCGLKNLAAAVGCGVPTLKKRLEEADMWTDEFVFVGRRAVPRGGRITQESVYWFRSGIVRELYRRERGELFSGADGSGEGADGSGEGG